MSDKVLTTNEVIEYLRITKGTLFKMVKEGKVRALRVGNAYRFKKDELDEDLKVTHEEARAATR
ncbi:MAG: Helix-turn-helix domain [Candidatus Poribacteria bacterium]|nr:Helix-turn-helix domain [Candidatus Poribacteria bacterium]